MVSSTSLLTYVISFFVKYFYLQYKQKCVKIMLLMSKCSMLLFWFYSKNMLKKTPADCLISHR